MSVDNERELFTRVAETEQAIAKVAGQVQTIATILDKLPEQLQKIQDTTAQSLRDTRKDFREQIDQLRNPKGLAFLIVGLVVGIVTLVGAPVGVYIAHTTGVQSDHTDQIRQLNREAALAEGIAEERRFWTAREGDRIAAELLTLHSQLDRMDGQLWELATDK